MTHGPLGGSAGRQALASAETAAVAAVAGSSALGRPGSEHHRSAEQQRAREERDDAQAALALHIGIWQLRVVGKAPNAVM